MNLCLTKREWGLVRMDALIAFFCMIIVFPASISVNKGKLKCSSAVLRHALLTFLLVKWRMCVQMFLRVQKPACKIVSIHYILQVLLAFASVHLFTFFLSIESKLAFFCSLTLIMIIVSFSWLFTQVQWLTTLPLSFPFFSFGNAHTKEEPSPLPMKDADAAVRWKRNVKIKTP